MNTAEFKRTNRLKVTLVAAALLAACLVALIWMENPAGAAFPGKNGKITFVRGTDNESEDREIYVMDAVDSEGDGNGDNLTKLTDNDAIIDTFANFSPDGSRVAFTSRRDGNPEVYVTRSDGLGTATRLTNNRATDEFPAFSPDGSELAFSSNRITDDSPTGDFEIYVIRLDAPGTPTPLTDNLVADSKPDWGPFLYDFVGFYEPVDNIPTTNAVKAGSAIPVKFSLSGDQGLDIFAEGYPRSGSIPADPGAELDDIEQTVTAGASGLTYDPAADQYTYVWKTDRAWSGQTRQLVLGLDDGSERVANFEFK
jgi:dipeptidyl aminopeptidase/acylaminoacyl peptidase